MVAGEPLSAGCPDGTGLRPALRSSARTAAESALADAAGGSLVRPVLAGGKPAVCASLRGRAVPRFHAGRQSDRVGALFSDVQPAPAAGIWEILGDIVLAAAGGRPARKEIFVVFEKNYEKHLFFCKKIGYNKKTKAFAGSRIRGNKRCACANRHSLQSC